MSLYQMQKFLFDINRDPAVQQKFLADRAAVLADYQLTAEEHQAIAAETSG